MPNSGNLYVFLHGLNVIADRGANLEIALPDVPGHVFKAGSWLNEGSIEKGAVLQLLHVQTGSYLLSQNQNVIQLPDCRLGHRKRAATLILPTPNTILDYLIAGDGTQTLAVRNDTQQGWKTLSMMQVLVYRFDDENQVQLDGHYWEPCSIGGAISLHVTSTSEGPEGLEHHRITEDVLAEMIHGYPGITVLKDAPVPEWKVFDDPGFGKNPPYVPNYSTNPPSVLHGGDCMVNGKQFAFSLAELEPIPARQFRLERLGRIQQQNRPLRELWHEPDALQDHVSNCWDMVV